MYLRARTLGNWDGSNDVHSYRADGKYQGVLSVNNQYPGELYLTGGKTTRRHSAWPLRGQGRRNRRTLEVAARVDLPEYAVTPHAITVNDGKIMIYAPTVKDLLRRHLGSAGKDADP